MSILFYKTRKALLTPIQKSQILCKPWENHDKQQQYGHFDGIAGKVMPWKIFYLQSANG